VTEKRNTPASAPHSIDEDRVAPTIPDRDAFLCFISQCPGILERQWASHGSPAVLLIEQRRLFRFVHGVRHLHGDWVNGGAEQQKTS
jgi:hypothetical protein